MTIQKLRHIHDILYYHDTTIFDKARRFGPNSWDPSSVKRITEKKLGIYKEDEIKKSTRGTMGKLGGTIK